MQYKKTLGAGTAILFLLIAIAPVVCSSIVIVSVDTKGDVIEILDVEKQQSIQPRCDYPGPWNLSDCIPGYDHYVVIFGNYGIASPEYKDQL